MATSRQLEKAIRRLTPYTPTHRGVSLEPLLTQLQELHASGSLDLPQPQI